MEEWWGIGPKIILIDEEYGYDQWYAIVSHDEYQEIENNWRSIRGLNCLVPVPFLIPQAQNYPLLEEHKKYTLFKTLIEEKVEIICAHIHESDDSYLGGIKTEPDEHFWFRGKKYEEQEVNEILQKHREAENRSGGPFITPPIWRAYNNKGNLLRRFVEAEWPEDEIIPEGWVRQGSVIVRKKYIVKKTGEIVEKA